MKKIRPYDLLINCLPEPIQKGVNGFKYKIVFLKKIHLSKLCMGEERN